ncbi:hypothetical protein Srufu_055650 [Streptomyces libani subsp. rufus]|nr:hypothetical protein Srufu_055650 [Streptomyces libani subsp. rufus]
MTTDTELSDMWFPPWWFCVNGARLAGTRPSPTPGRERGGRPALSLAVARRRVHSPSELFHLPERTARRGVSE